MNKNIILNINGHSTTINIADVLLCTIAGIFFYHIATWHIEFAIFNGEYTPAFPDSFYHATRILDSFRNGGLVQFDPRFHAPEGAWVTWPWGYDWLIAKLLIIGVYFTGMSPLKILVHIPPIWGVVNIFLLVSLSKALGLSFSYRVIIALCFILLPLNQQLHLVGRVDHHYMEMTMVLLSTVTTINWFQSPSSKFYAIASGLVLGSAMAIHNSLFILQAPVIACLILVWAYSREIPKTTIYFSISLFFSTLLFLLPAETFHAGFFSFYYHSFFHLYISFCVALLAYLLYFFKLTKKHVLIILAITVLMTLPLINIFLSGYGFISGDWNFLSSMKEVKSILAFDSSQRLGVSDAIKNYSAYILLLPIGLAYLFYRVYKRFELEYVYLALFSLLAVFLMLKQIRFHHFGSFILFIPIALMFQNSLSLEFNKNLRISGFIMLTLLAFWLPAGTLFKKQPMSTDFAATYWAAKVLKKECEEDAGIILAPASIGHYLTYFTNCSVIANSFIMAPEDFKYLKLTEQLFDMDADQLHSSRKEIKYVFLFREDNLYLDLATEEIDSLNPTLSKNLLFSDVLPDYFKLLFEVKYQLPKKDVVFARAVKIIR